MDQNITERLAASIVTGAGRGIGRAIALRLVSQGAVMLVGQNETNLASVKKEIERAGGKADVVVGDVSNPLTAEEAVTRLQDNGWYVKNLVANAGIAKGGPSDSFSRKLWQEIFAVNVNGAFWFMQECLPHFVDRKSGTICVIGSIASVRGYKRDAAYCASKHALIGLTRAIAIEYASRGVTTVAVCPGFVETDMTVRTVQGLMRHRKISEAEARKIVAAENPQKRIITPDEVADCVLTVCEGKLQSLNGSVLMLTGGA